MGKRIINMEYNLFSPPLTPELTVVWYRTGTLKVEHTRHQDLSSKEEHE
jgi:hypothetical protein